MGLKGGQYRGLWSPIRHEVKGPELTPILSMVGLPEQSTSSYNRSFMHRARYKTICILSYILPMQRWMQTNKHDVFSYAFSLMHTNKHYLSSLMQVHTTMCALSLRYREHVAFLIRACPMSEHHQPLCNPHSEARNPKRNPTATNRWVKV